MHVLLWFFVSLNLLLLFDFCFCVLLVRRGVKGALICLVGADVLGAAVVAGEPCHNEDLTRGQEAEGGLGVKPMAQGVADLEGGQGGFTVNQGVLNLVDDGAGSVFV